MTAAAGKSLLGCDHTLSRSLTTDRTLSVVLLYDYCLTFIQEIELFWMSAWTGAAVLFFMNRYITLVFKIYAFLSFAPALFTSDAVRWCSCILKE